VFLIGDRVRFRSFETAVNQIEAALNQQSLMSSR
jgi:hypothetical protein